MKESKIAIVIFKKFIFKKVYFSACDYTTEIICISFESVFDSIQDFVSIMYQDDDLKTALLKYK